MTAAATNSKQMRPAWLGNASLLWIQIRNSNRIFWREPLAAFFTMVFPLLFLLLFGFIISGEVRGVSFSHFFTVAIAAFAAATATFTNLTISMSIQRDQGILKRVRGTPVPPWIYMSGRILSSVWTAFLAIVILFTVGWLFFDFMMVWRNLPIALLVFILSVATFSAMGLAVCSLIKSADSAPAVANAIILPMAFLSEIFIPLEDAPTWLQVLGDIFPLKHFSLLLNAAFDPFSTGPVLGWDRLGVLTIWLVVGLLVAIRFFKWLPRGSN